MLNTDIQELVKSLVTEMYTTTNKIDDVITTDEIIENILKASANITRDEIREHYLNMYLEQLGFKFEPIPKSQDRIWYIAKK